VVVIGGGFAGCTFSKYLSRAYSAAQITLVEPGTSFTTCVFSNEVVAGLNTLKNLTVTYDKLVANYNIQHLATSAKSIDPVAHKVQLASGDTLPYDKLVMAPGMVYRFDTIPGWSKKVAKQWPVAWHAGPETTKLENQLASMTSGGTAIITVPPMPYRCPPAPYERASLFAWYFTQNNPTAKVLMLDSNDTFAMQALFEEGWANLYPGMVTRISGPDGGAVESVDSNAMTVTCSAGTFHGDLINIIPPQKSGSLAEATGLTDDTLWCPVDDLTFASRLVADIHVVGDSAESGLPKSATSGNAGAKIAALAMAETFLGNKPTDPVFINTCYARMAPDYSIGIVDVFGLDANGNIKLRHKATGTTPLNASLSYHKEEAIVADKWYRSLISDTFT
jgi:sulfide dehydrogenase [flavocytochrome c] flavoprotein subunit